MIIISNVFSSDRALYHRLMKLVDQGYIVKSSFCIALWQIIKLQRKPDVVKDDINRKDI